MTNIEKLKSEICSYIDSCTNLNKQGLHKFIDSLSSDFFVVKPKTSYLIYVKPADEDKEDFIKFMISCGFGDEGGFWSNAKEQDGGIIFDTSSSIICEFVVKDGLKRRYSVVLDDVPLDEDNNIKRVILDNISSAQYKVTFNFDATIEDEVASESAASASYDYRYKVQDRSLLDILGIKDRNIVLNIQPTRGDIPSVIGQIVGRSGYYKISYPIHAKVTIIVNSSDSEKYIIFKKALEVFSSNINCDTLQITRQNLENIELYA